MEHQDMSYEHVFEDVAFLEMAGKAQRVLRTLKPREADVVRLRFGLGGVPGHDRGEVYTQADIGKMLGVSATRISQIESKALRRLRHPSRSKRLHPYGGMAW